MQRPAEREYDPVTKLWMVRIALIGGDEATVVLDDVEYLWFSELAGGGGYKGADALPRNGLSKRIYLMTDRSLAVGHCLLLFCMAFCQGWGGPCPGALLAGDLRSATVTEEAGDHFEFSVAGDVSGQIALGNGNYLIRSEGHRPASARPATDRTRPTHYTIVAMDVSQSGSLDDQLQLRMRADLRSVVGAALARQRLDVSQIDRDDLGDGVRLVAPATIPPGIFLDPFIPDLAGALREHRRAAADVARLRLRVAVHMGLLQRDDQGWVGQPLVHCARLLDAQPVREALVNAVEADLVLVVSQTVHDAVVRQGYGLDSASYRQVIIDEKETQATAWVHVPSYPVPPS